MDYLYLEKRCSSGRLCTSIVETICETWDTLNFGETSEFGLLLAECLKGM